MAEAELKVRLALERGRAVRHERSLPPVTGLRQYLPPLDPAADPPLHGLVGRSPAMQQLFRQIDRVARFGSTVLITGESGTGKELVARALHAASPRARAPFVAVNCGAIPENLLESELFGHVRGAFTDASADRRGLFEEAHGGTLLLDEITDLPLHLQVKLLRVLQEGEIRKVGGNRAQAVDVRVVAASAVPVRARVAEGRFREDLYYRLAVIELALPPLRVRGDDLPLLVHHLIGRTNQRLGTRVTAIEPAALALLQARPWPGNVRELHNVIEQACVMAEGPQLTAALFAEAGQQGPDQQDLGQHDERHDPSAGTTAAALAAAQESAAPPSLSIPAAVSAIEARLIREALTRTGGNRTQAAALLAISPRNLHDKIRQYAIGMAAPHGRPRRKPATTGQGETP
jgi:two-component system response regulator AtoC